MQMRVRNSGWLARTMRFSRFEMVKYKKNSDASIASPLNPRQIPRATGSKCSRVRLFLVVVDLVEAPLFLQGRQMPDLGKKSTRLL